MSDSSQLAVREAAAVDVQLHRADDFMPVMSIEQAVGRYQMIRNFARSVMKEGRDYGVIPGTDKPRGDATPNPARNTLLKPGAEKLCTLFGLVPEYGDYRIVEDWDRGLFYYAFRCTLNRDGRKIGEGIGSANSWEKKYRRGGRVCPTCQAPTIMRSKYPPRDDPEGEPGWYCNSRGGGCGAQYDHGDQRIREQTMKVDPMDSADVINTLMKMGQKRSLIAAVLVATNASEFFTQDVNDLGPAADPDGSFVEPHTEPHVEAATTEQRKYIDELLRRVPELDTPAWRRKYAGPSLTRDQADKTIELLERRRKGNGNQVDAALGEQGELPIMRPTRQRQPVPAERIIGGNPMAATMTADRPGEDDIPF